jgi:hypothetical protein
MNRNTPGQPQQTNQHSSPSLLDSYESSENALMDSFKAAALKVTTLYKDSLVQNRQAYASGYQQALQDLYEFISSHPSTTVSMKNSFTTTPTEHGHLPVQDLLTYARQRNHQLASDMGVSSPSLATATPVPERTQQSTSPIPTTTTVNSTTIPTNRTASGMIGAAVKNAFHPFQIDPHTQFTFLPPSPTNLAHDDDRMEPMLGVDDGLKRRMAPNDLSFMGRSLNSMNIDSHWNEPAFKRRHKRDG